MLRGLTTVSFVAASVVDPFGNILGVMFNQHDLDVLAARAGA